MADLCADRNEAFTGGYSDFASGQERRPPHTFKTRELTNFWLDGWDQAAMTLQRSQQTNFGLIEKRDQILGLLLESAVLARGFANTNKISVRDRRRCQQLCRDIEKIEQQIGQPKGAKQHATTN